MMDWTDVLLAVGATILAIYIGYGDPWVDIPNIGDH